MHLLPSCQLDSVPCCGRTEVLIPCWLSAGGLCLLLAATPIPPHTFHVPHIHPPAVGVGSSHTLKLTSTSSLLTSAREIH